MSDETTLTDQYLAAMCTCEHETGYRCRACFVQDEVDDLRKAASCAKFDPKYCRWPGCTDSAPVVQGPDLPSAAQFVIDIAASVQCPCTVRERDSGHRSDCYLPELTVAIGQLRTALDGQPKIACPTDGSGWHRVGDRMPLAHATVAICVRLDENWDFRTGFMDEGGDWFMHPNEKLDADEICYWASLRYPPNPDVTSGVGKPDWQCARGRSASCLCTSSCADNASPERSS